MAKTTFLFLLSLIYITCAAMAAPITSSAATNFIKSSCRATRYPPLCIQSLSVYATSIQQSPRQLTQTALSVSLARAQSAKTFVTKLRKFKGLKAREIEAIKDCVKQMDQTVEKLGESMEEMKNLGRAKGQDFVWRMSNVQTWVSSALTNANTCIDGFEGKELGGKIKDSIKGQVFKVVQVTSNALALVNLFAPIH